MSPGFLVPPVHVREVIVEFGVGDKSRGSEPDATGPLCLHLLKLPVQMRGIVLDVAGSWWSTSGSRTSVRTNFWTGLSSFSAPWNSAFVVTLVIAAFPESFADLKEWN